MRLACLFVPLFPLAARLRSEPELKGEAVAIFEGNGNAARAVAASRTARRAGIEPGMTLPQTRALLPKLAARGRDRECERAAQEALLEVADSFSPRVEDSGDGVVYLDLEGIPALNHKSSSPIHNSQFSTLNSSLNHQSQITKHKWIAESERRLGQDLIAAAEKASLPARLGLAASKLAARVAAGLPDSPTVVPPGEEASFLAPLPLSRLAPEMETAAALERWGIRSIGELAKLPEGEVASRLGELGRELHATARGIDPRPLEPRPAPLRFSEGLELEWPLVSLEPFLFVGQAALERLMRRLESQALACTRLEVALKLDPDGHDTRALALPAPTRDVKTLLTLVRLELEARPPGAPVAGFAFTAHPDKPRSVELSLFGPAALSPDRLAMTIARLASILGPDRIGSPRTVDGHRPERFALADYSPPPPPRFAGPRRVGRGLLAVRILRPPVPLEVIVATACSGPADAPTCGSAGRNLDRPPGPSLALAPAARGSSPLGDSSRCDRDADESGDREITNHQSQITNLPNSLRLVSLKTLAPDAAPAIAGSVRVASGPWSLEEGWWTETPADRDYWDIELTDGALYRIYRDRQSGTWFADGIYD